MSTTRIIIRVLLVVAIAGVLWLGYRTWARSQPDYYRTRAAAAIEAKQWQAARINLQNLLQRFPEDGQALKDMAMVQLEEARASDETEGRVLPYAAVPSALAFLASAADKLPDDAELQQQVLAAFLRRGQMGDAATVAKRVLEKTPDHADALYAVAYAAVDADNVRDAEDAFTKLRTSKSRRVFSTFALQAQLYQQNNEDAKLDKTLAEATATAKRLKPDQMELLIGRDRDIMADLLVQSASLAKDSSTASARVDAGLIALESAKAKDLLDDSKIATSASKMSLALNMKFPVASDDKAGKQQRSQLDQRAAALTTAATTESIAEPAVYYQAAVAEFSMGTPEANLKGYEILENGIEACKDLPEERRDEVLNLHLLLARRYVMARKFGEADKHIRVLIENEHSAGMAHLLAGSSANFEGKQEQALEHYKRAQRELGNTLLVRMGLANCHLALKQWEEALPHLRELHVSLQNMDDEEKQWVARELGGEANVHLGELTARLALKQWDEAQPHLLALRGTNLAEPAWAMAIGFLWSDDKRTAARKMLSEAREKYPTSVRLLQAEAQILTAIGQQDRIPALLLAFSKQNPDLLVAQLLLAQMKLKAKDAQGALDHLESIPKAIYSKPDEQRAVNALRAQALLALDRPDAALALAETLEGAQASLVEAAVKAQQDDIAGAADLVAKAGDRSGYLRMLEGQLLAKQGEFGSAVDAFAKSLDVTAIRTAARGQVLKSLLLLSQKKGPVEAERKTDQLLKLYPGDSVLLVAKGEFQVQQGNFDLALETFEAVEQADPKVATGPNLKAAVWLKRKEYDKAYSEAQRALAIEPTNIMAISTAAEASLADRQFSRAAEISAEGMLAHPKNWRLIQMRYQALRALEKIDEALKLLDDTMEDHPEMPEAYLLRGAELIAAKKEAEALEVYQKGFAAAPKAFGLVVAEVGLHNQMNNHAKAVEVAKEKFDGEKNGVGGALSLGQVFASATQWETAADWGRQALELAKENKNERVAALVFLGDIALKEAMVDKVEAKFGEARDRFQEVISAQSNHFVAGNNLAWLLAVKFNKANEAAKIAEEVRGDVAVDRLPPTFIDTICEVYRRCGRDDDARRLVQEAIKAFPEEAALQFHLGVLLAERDKPTAAKALASALKAGLSAEQEAEAKKVLAELTN